MRKLLLIFSILFLFCNYAEAHPAQVQLDGIAVFNTALNKQFYTQVFFVHSVDNTFTVVIGNPEDENIPLEICKWYFFKGDDARRLFQTALNTPETPDTLIGRIESSMRGAQTLVIGYNDEPAFLLGVENEKSYSQQGFILTKTQLRKVLNIF